MGGSCDFCCNNFLYKYSKYIFLFIIENMHYNSIRNTRREYSIQRMLKYSNSCKLPVYKFHVQTIPIISFE